MGGQMIIETPRVDKMASLPLRPLLRAVQPHEIRSDSFGGLGAMGCFHFKEECYEIYDNGYSPIDGGADGATFV